MGAAEKALATALASVGSPASEARVTKDAAICWAAGLSSLLRQPIATGTKAYCFFLHQKPEPPKEHSEKKRLIKDHGSGESWASSAKSTKYCNALEASF
ncbi:MAG: hypothetical protein CMQ23_00300 [Gammaproteobacteria bacterium]|nr:hypothetical protein [Gammaproteobacteria bacterium]